MTRKHLSLEVLNALHAVATPVHKERGAVLFREGRRCRGAFLIRKGQVKLTLDAASRLYPARVVGSGVVIGLPPTLSGEPYSLTAEVKDDCQLDFIPRRKFLSVLRHSPRAGVQIVGMLSKEIALMRNAAKRSS